MKTPNDSPRIPRLRFPEFQNAGEWEVKKLGEVLVEPKKKPVEDPTKYELLSVRLHSLGVVNTGKRPTKTEKGRPYYIRNINEILIGRQNFHNGSIGIVKKENDGGVCSNAISSFVVENEYLLFVFYYVARKSYYSIANDLIGGTGQKEISHKELLNFKILVPSLPEQQKIASCLSSLDEVIAGERQKLELLQQHKKGLLQQLFPQEGETVPRLRFPEFQNAGEWVFDTFFKYIKLYRGSSPRPIQNYITTDDSGVNWIKIGDTKNAENFIIRKTEEKITQEGAKKSRKVNVGELILANSMSFGKTYQLEIEGYIYDGWFVLREFEKYFDKRFLLQLLNSEYMQKQYERLSAGGIVQNISSDIVYSTILPHTTIAEQQKIAACLSSLDDLIAAQSQKIELLEQHKKGMVQGLFPMENG
jgi:type I restriction enzyme S subunit